MAGPVARSGNATVEVELFPSKHSNLRDMFISELHLSEGDVGQHNWIKIDQKFTARLQVNLEENAIGYLVRKWNDLQINVGGEAVSDQVANANKGLKREGSRQRGSSHLTSATSLARSTSLPRLPPLTPTLSLTMATWGSSRLKNEDIWFHRVPNLPRNLREKRRSS